LIRSKVIHERRIDILLKEIGYDFDNFHRVLTDHQAVNLVSLQLAPRGSGKTTVGTIGAALLEILIDPNVRILLASDIVTHAQNFLSELKSCLIHPRVVEIFGDQRGDKWNDTEITTRGRTLPRKEPTIAITGVDSSITSMHFDFIFADDLVTLGNSRTDGSRHKVYQWFYTTLMPCITDARTVFRVLGTRYHPDDLYNHLMTKDPKFKNSTQIIPALKPDTEESNLNKWTTPELHELRESMGFPFFNSQMNQNAAGIQGYIFDDKFFRYTKSFPAKLITFTGVDLAVGRKKENAKFAIVTIGICPKTYNIYLLKYHSAKLSLKQQDEQIISVYEDMNPIAVGIESNAFQASKIQSLRGNKNTSHIPAIPIHTDIDKITRAQRLAVRFERGEIFFHESERGGSFEAQLLEFPNGKYKDLVDALDIAVNTALRRRKRKKNNRKEPGLISPGRKFLGR
jgi:predicted phage terminase large subunit-like protein